MEKTVRILNEEGMHARPAGLFVKVASQFKSKIELRANGTTKNGKSIMSLMSLGLTAESEMTIVAEGEDAQAALDSLAALVNRKFQE